MKFGEAIKDGYALVRTQYGPEYIDITRYIEYLASSQRKDIKEWEFAVFLNSRGKPYLMKAEINRLFMQELLKVPSKTEGFRLSPEDATKVSELSSVNQTSERSRLTRDKANIEARLTSLTNEFNTAMTNLRTVNDKIKRMAGPVIDTRFVSEIEKTVDDGFWKWNGFNRNGTKLVFISASDIIVGYKNKAAGIDLTVNFGKFKIKLDPGSLFPEVTPGDNAFRLNDSTGYFHPHVSNGARGHICWGNLGSALTTAQGNVEISKVMSLCQQLLLSYNSGNPYVSLERFEIGKVLFDAGMYAYTFGGGYVPQGASQYIQRQINALSENAPSGKIVNGKVLAPFLEHIFLGGKLHWRAGSIVRGVIDGDALRLGDLKFHGFFLSDGKPTAIFRRPGTATNWAANGIAIDGPIEEIK